MFLPVSIEDMEKRGWSEADFVMVTADAYVDHPSFGTAIISRVLEAHGYKVAIIAQPDFRSTEDFMRFGRPRLGFMINGGNVDSMVNNYSVFRHRRKRDVYSPGGKAGKRPDRAVIVYSNRVREAYGDVPVVIGGLEASLRRFGHYDYWDDKVRRSVLMDSGADILVYGMGERACVEIAEALEAGIDVHDIDWIRGTCVKKKKFTIYDDDIILPDFDEISRSKKEYCRSFAMQYRSNDAINGVRMIESYGGISVVQNPPQPPLEREELDDVYGLPYMRDQHPSYEEEGGVPALKEVKFSITSNRGCFGGCAFCAITYHQGREVRSRSIESVVREAEILTTLDDFKGYIHDVGGPTANFRHPSCKKQLKDGMCRERDCLFPKPCGKLDADHSEYMQVLEAVRNVPGVRKVFVRSGIRYDYMLQDRENDFLGQLCRHHVSGILKVAPEHVSPEVLRAMHKPGIEVFERFRKKFGEKNRAAGKEQYMIPYFISSHPASTLDDAVDLALYLKKSGFVPDQVQDFYPTPGTLSTCMYYTEMDPFTMKRVYVPKTMKEKRLQRALLHFHKKENREDVMEALRMTGREELADVLLPHGRKDRGKRRVPDRRHR